MIAPTTFPATEPPAPQADGGWLTQLARLVRWELFLAWRRRAMMITLSSLLLVGYLLLVLIQYVVYYTSSDPTVVSLGFPGALGAGGSYIAYAGVPLFVVLAGALIGSEYSYSTLRLSLARGVARGQLLAAQVVALAIIALLLTGLTLAVSALSGGIAALVGVTQAPVTLSVGMMGEVALYWLALAFNLFAYAMISVWIGSLSRSVAGAIAGPLVFIVVEVVARDILLSIGFISRNDTLLKAIAQIPNFLLGVNTNALITLAGAGPYPLTAGVAPVSQWHALIVSVAYCALFICISYLMLRYRDITE